MIRPSRLRRRSSTLLCRAPLVTSDACGAASVGEPFLYAVDGPSTTFTLFLARIVITTAPAMHAMTTRTPTTIPAMQPPPQPSDDDEPEDGEDGEGADGGG